MSDLITIPEEKYAPKPGAAPSHIKGVPNYADNEESVGKALDWLRQYKQHFDQQGQRTQYDTQADCNDEMYRAAKTRAAMDAEASANTEDTRSNVTSTAYYRSVRSRTAGEATVILGNDEDLPMEYEPMLDAEDYREDEGMRIAEDQTALLAYTFEVAKMRPKIADALLWANKYGNRVQEMYWDRRVEERTERVPSEFAENEDGTRRPTKFKWETKKRVIADWPAYRDWDLKDCWFDTMIADMQEQSCVITRCQKQLGDLWQLQASSLFKNVGKITTAQLYGSEGEGDTLGARQSNAGENGDADEPTTLFDVYRAFIRLPIDDATGKWEPKKVLPHWYETWWAGQLDGGTMVCLALSPNRHFNKKIPLDFLHSHHDDKGAIAMSFGTLVKCLDAQSRTNFNQAIDNITERNWAPWIATRGSINQRSMVMVAGHNKVWFKKPGASDPKIVDVPDTTAITMQMHDKIEELIKDTMGTNKPFLGEPMGSRTSASEAKMVFEQAVKPALVDAQYKADQMLPFIAEWCYEMWRQFGDPKRTVFVTYHGVQREIKPAELWGPLNIRVTSIKRFQDNLIRRQEEDNLLNVLMPTLEKYATPKGITQILDDVLRNRDFQNVGGPGFWKTPDDFDARHVAKSENQAILFQGVTDYPKPEENHEAHLAEHNPTLATYVLLPPDEQDPDAIRRMKMHIQMHKDMAAQAEQSAAASAQQAPMNEGAAPQLEGEALGDMQGAVEGAAAGQPGRPPLYEGALA